MSIQIPRFLNYKRQQAALLEADQPTHEAPTDGHDYTWCPIHQAWEPLPTPQELTDEIRALATASIEVLEDIAAEAYIGNRAKAVLTLIALIETMEQAGKKITLNLPLAEVVQQRIEHHAATGNKHWVLVDADGAPVARGTDVPDEEWDAMVAEFDTQWEEQARRYRNITEVERQLAGSGITVLEDGVMAIDVSKFNPESAESMSAVSEALSAGLFRPRS